MQNRYAGDLGDFLKIALLRWLVAPQAGEADLRLGIVWYLVPDEGHNSDGKHVAYLDSAHASATRFRSLDVELYDGLATMMRAGPSRSVLGLERAGVLPTGTVTYREALSFADLAPGNRLARVQRRQGWLDAALAATEACDVVFCRSGQRAQT